MNQRIAGLSVAFGVFFFSAVSKAAPEVGSALDHQQLEHLQRRVDEIAAASASSTVRSHAASVVLLIGLVIEIVGALFLAGPALAAKLEDVLSLHGGPGWKDLALESKDGERSLNFLGAIGALFLTAGFVVQLTGTLIGMGVGASTIALLGGISVAFAALVLHFLLGLSPEQTRLEKIAVVWRNTKRILPSRSVRCDYCNGSISSDDAQIRWYEAKRSEKYPFLYPPHRWHVGHTNCLDASPWYPPIVKLPGQTPEETKTATFTEFLSERGNREAYWASYVRDHNSKSPSPITSTPPEIEYRAVLKKVERAVT